MLIDHAVELLATYRNRFVSAVLAHRGLVAATYTPFNELGDLALQTIQPMVDSLVQRMVIGLHVWAAQAKGCR